MEEERLYLRIFAQEGGYGMPLYRGSPMIGGSFFGRLVTFAKGLFRQAAPHVSKLINQAHPHVRNAANKAVESAIDSAVNHVTEKLKNIQEGKGIKARQKQKKRLRHLSITDNF
jgi:hypothetical protein